MARRFGLLEAWFAPFALINGSAVGLVPILLPVVSAKYGVGHVGLVMGAFNLGAFAAPLTGALADKFRAYRLIAIGCAAISAVSLWLFPLAGSAVELLLALTNGAGFAGAVTIANLLIVERSPKAEWNDRLGWLETVLGVGQGSALLLAAWLATLRPDSALLVAALVPAAAIPLAAFLIRTPPVPARPPAPATPPAPAGTAAATAGPAATRSGAAAPPAPAALPVRPPHGGPPPFPAHLALGTHRLRHNGLVGEWGPASPTRVHHLQGRRRPFAGARALLNGGFGWMLAAWAFAYAGTAIVFSLYPVLFSHAFGVAPQTSALAFAAIVFVSLPLFVLAGKTSQGRGPVPVIIAGMGSRVVLLGLLAVFAAVGHIPYVLPLAAFAGIMFAWSFLSVASPALTAQLVPEAEGDAQGMLNASSGIAGLVGSVAGGGVADTLGYPAALSLGAASVALGLLIFIIRLARRRPVPH